MMGIEPGLAACTPHPREPPQAVQLPESRWLERPATPSAWRHPFLSCGSRSGLGEGRRSKGVGSRRRGGSAEGPGNRLELPLHQRRGRATVLHRSQLGNRAAGGPLHQQPPGPPPAPTKLTPLQLPDRCLPPKPAPSRGHVPSAPSPDPQLQGGGLGGPVNRVARSRLGQGGEEGARGGEGRRQGPREPIAQGRGMTVPQGWTHVCCPASVHAQILPLF